MLAVSSFDPLSPGSVRAGLLYEHVYNRIYISALPCPLPEVQDSHALSIFLPVGHPLRELVSAYNAETSCPAVVALRRLRSGVGSVRDREGDPAVPPTPSRSACHFCLRLCLGVGPCAQVCPLLQGPWSCWIKSHPHDIIEI